jgi:hypothetical protein
MNHGNTSSVKSNSGQKSTMIKRDCCTLRRTVSKNYRTTASQVTAKLNIHLEDPASTKTVRHQLLKSNICGMAATAKLLLLKVIPRCINDGVMTIKPGYQITGNTCVIWSDESSFMLFLISGTVYV